MITNEDYHDIRDAVREELKDFVKSLKLEIRHSCSGHTATKYALVLSTKEGEELLRFNFGSGDGPDWIWDSVKERGE